MRIDMPLASRAELTRGVREGQGDLTRPAHICSAAARRTAAQSAVMWCFLAFAARVAIAAACRRTRLSRLSSLRVLSPELVATRSISLSARSNLRITLLGTFSPASGIHEALIDRAARAQAGPEDAALHRRPPSAGMSMCRLVSEHHDASRWRSSFLRRDVSRPTIPSSLGKRTQRVQQAEYK